MSYRKSLYFVLTLFAIMGIGVMYMGYGIEDFVPARSVMLGSKFYPMALGALILLFSILSLFETKRKEDKVIPLPNIKNYFIVLGIIVIWIIAWTQFHIFYPASLIAVGGMLLIFDPAPMSGRKLLRSLLIDFAIVAFFFVCFKIMLQINL